LGLRVTPPGRPAEQRGKRRDERGKGGKVGAEGEGEGEGEGERKVIERMREASKNDA